MAKQGSPTVYMKIEDEFDVMDAKRKMYVFPADNAQKYITSKMNDLKQEWLKRGLRMQTISEAIARTNTKPFRQYVYTHINIDMPEYNRDTLALMHEILTSYKHFTKLDDKLANDGNYKRKGEIIFRHGVKRSNKVKRNNKPNIDISKANIQDKLDEPNAKRQRIASPKQSPRPKKVTIRQRYGAIFGHVKKPSANRTRRQKRHTSV